MSNRAKGWLMTIAFSIAFYSFFAAIGYGVWLIVTGQ